MHFPLRLRAECLRMTPRLVRTSPKRRRNSPNADRFRFNGWTKYPDVYLRLHECFGGTRGLGVILFTSRTDRQNLANAIGRGWQMQRLPISRRSTHLQALSYAFCSVTTRNCLLRSWRGFIEFLSFVYIGCSCGLGWGGVVHACRNTTDAFILGIYR